MQWIKKEEANKFTILKLCKVGPWTCSHEQQYTTFSFYFFKILRIPADNSGSWDMKNALVPWTPPMNSYWFKCLAAHVFIHKFAVFIHPFQSFLMVQKLLVKFKNKRLLLAFNLVMIDLWMSLGRVGLLIRQN